MTRLIDADALLSNVETRCKYLWTFGEEDYWAVCYGMQQVEELINSAPTVETTDDVLARIPYPCEIIKTVTNVGTRYFGKTVENQTKFFDNPLEAVNKLEASIHSK